MSLINHTHKQQKKTILYGAPVQNSLFTFEQFYHNVNINVIHSGNYIKAHKSNQNQIILYSMTIP